MIASFWHDHAAAIVAVIWLTAIAVAGGAMTEVGAWYESLRFPRLRPPNWLFGPAWTTLYILIGIGCVQAWYAADATWRPRLLLVLAVNTALNVLWSPLFFKLKRPDWALLEWIPFWASVGSVWILVYAIKPEAAWFIAPYWAWVTFAGWLNWRIVVLNSPFRRRAA